MTDSAGQPARFVVAVSGGLDSVVLTHALASICQTARRQLDEFASIPLLAVHIDHGLQAASADWSLRCASIAKSLGCDFRAICVDVRRDGGKGLEAAARDARYSALRGELRAGDWLLSAHHQNDQAETLLLNLLRGSGPLGLSGIAPVRRFSPGWLLRPLLDVAQVDLLEYANNADLHWIDDPSNADRHFDRNFLRHEILPMLNDRWPDVSVRLGRATRHAAEASGLLNDMAATDLELVGGNCERLSVAALSNLCAARQRNLIRFALRECGLSSPTSAHLEQIQTELMPAREDGQPLVRWPGASVRRYRDGLYLLPEKLVDKLSSGPILDREATLAAGLGCLRFEDTSGKGLSPALFQAGLRLDVRRGGERIRVKNHEHRSKLKKLLQELGVVPWMRDRIPLVYSGEQLVAVGDLWLAADAVATPGVAVHWIGRPALH